MIQVLWLFLSFRQGKATSSLCEGEVANQCEDVRPQEQWRYEPGPKTTEKNDVEQLSLLSHSAVPCLYRCSLKCNLKALDLTAANKLSLAEIVARCNYLSSSFPAARPTTCHDKFQRPRLH
jgi:hypothetical protein